MIRSYIKWAGGKARVMPELLEHLPAGDCLVEPFVGSGTVFLNTNYRRYILGDINPDLINMHRVAMLRTDLFIDAARCMFEHGNNSAYFEDIKNALNAQRHLPYFTPDITRAAQFLYLNRHGYNGLCRYSKKTGFNVPFGKFKNVYFPENEIRLFAEKARDTKAIFVCVPYNLTLKLSVEGGVVIYCDPPYLPLNDSSSFTQYHTAPFTEADHRKLADMLRQAADLGARVVLSNSDTPLTREIYHRFRLHEISVARSVAANGSRGEVGELIGTMNAQGLGCPSGGCGQCQDSAECLGISET
ncbi:TPA: Dam family site-specific DNA-(adenine-N6)-methyltransferase [Klebsiella pneumoniae]|uniref:DNA adenine methylase n=1 Tax=Klebsiella pneumoniae TaxID=573 RepID=UPI000E2E46E0|nr:Dam family site-specific DNA-(adenine-N6)-methyltransferase [Klebsiella pneumoniae]HBR1366640.1 Dam family site-specific DNA-(adenine-N6)-methyltransferase [Klebsiella pneumoniae]HBR2015033.1 Dam family site-specific DNA-(adenine-N6)-methyltransferase [Klebsiella pneumoniae]